MSRFNSALTWLADHAVIGGLVVLGSAAIVTAPAAFAAGAAASRSESLSESVPCFFITFVRSVKAGLASGVIVLTLATSMVLSLLWLVPDPDQLTQIVGMAAGLQAAIAAILLTVYSAAAIDMNVAANPRNAGVLALATPATAFHLLALTAVGSAIAGIMPVLALPIVGAIAQTVGSVEVRYVRRQQTFSTAGPRADIDDDDRSSQIPNSG